MRIVTRTSSRKPLSVAVRNNTNTVTGKAGDQKACLRKSKKSRSTEPLSTPDTSVTAMMRKGHDPCSGTTTIGRKRVQSLDYEIRTPSMRSSLDLNYYCSSCSPSLTAAETSTPSGSDSLQRKLPPPLPITPATFSSGFVDQDDIPECSGDSLLEALPFDVLVCILCRLNHDELKPLFHVCKRLRKAVESARQSHFNFTTPYQCRQRMLQFSTPRPLKYRSFSRLEENDVPATPRAPKQVARTTQPHCNSNSNCVDIEKIAMTLFQAPTAERSCMPTFRSRRHISHRVLFAQPASSPSPASNHCL